MRKAFATYLKKDNHGRPFVLIGHSQGWFVLERLIAKDIDPKSSVRRRLLSAILLGGNVLVRRGHGIGGTFKHIPACPSASQLGCVIAFSTFDQTPPANSLFGRPRSTAIRCCAPIRPRWTGVRPTSTRSSPRRRSPPGTLIAVGKQLLHLTQPHPPTVWFSEPAAYRAQCSSADGANVLRIAPLRGAQVPTPSPDATWGLHLLDANIALGDLVTVVRKEAEAYAARASATRS